MSIPHGPECLDSINNTLKENNITLPKVPPMPQFPTQLSQITQQIPSLPPELKEEYTHIGQRFTRYPRELYEEINLQLNQLNQQYPGLSRASQILPTQLSSLPQQLSNLPQHLSQLPQQIYQLPERAQQYYLNVQNRLNSLKPEDA